MLRKASSGRDFIVRTVTGECFGCSYARDSCTKSKSAPDQHSSHYKAREHIVAQGWLLHVRNVEMGEEVGGSYVLGPSTLGGDSG